MHENENIYFFFKFWRKSGILIPDLYFYNFYDVKIQINIKQNLVENNNKVIETVDEPKSWSCCFPSAATNNMLCYY